MQHGNAWNIHVHFQQLHEFGKGWTTCPSSFSSPPPPPGSPNVLPTRPKRAAGAGRWLPLDLRWPCRRPLRGHFDPGLGWLVKMRCGRFWGLSILMAKASSRNWNHHYCIPGAREIAGTRIDMNGSVVDRALLETSGLPYPCRHSEVATLI